MVNNTVRKLNVGRIKSVVKVEFNRDSLTVPPKHPRKFDQIEEEN